MSPQQPLHTGYRQLTGPLAFPVRFNRPPAVDRLGFILLL